MASRKTIFVTRLTDVMDTDVEGVGTIRQDGLNNWYKWVRLRNTTATVATAIGGLLSYASAGYNTSTVVSDFTDAQAAPVGAGLAQAVAAGVAGTDYFLWVLVKGKATLYIAAAGSSLTGSAVMADAAVDLGATLQTFSGTTPNITAVGARIGILMSTAGGKLITMDCPF